MYFSLIVHLVAVIIGLTSVYASQQNAFAYNFKSYQTTQTSVFKTVFFSLLVPFFIVCTSCRRVVLKQIKTILFF